MEVLSVLFELPANWLYMIGGAMRLFGRGRRLAFVLHVNALTRVSNIVDCLSLCVFLSVSLTFSPVISV